MIRARFQILGQRFTAESSDGRLVDVICRRWNEFQEREPRDEPGEVVELDPARSAGLLADRVASGIFLQRVSQALYPRAIVIHGSLIEAEEGLAVLVSGGSGSGKSTLAAIARARGVECSADELVAIGTGGRIWPLPVSSGVRDATKHLLAEMGLDFLPFASRGHGRARRLVRVHLLDDAQTPTSAALFSHCFNGWCQSPGKFLMELVSRLAQFPIHRHQPLRLQDEGGRAQARRIANLIINALV